MSCSVLIVTSKIFLVIAFLRAPFVYLIFSFSQLLLVGFMLDLLFSEIKADMVPYILSVGLFSNSYDN
ncbi:hypothetical protein QVD17_21176 [Tagetes erecta]|uniref:Uncharacterized protein n=1 Tax=Tagetes erecta TaxID=13708 RepID=A0AAD8KU48_TARER|nr:hypothetical protein QVD17_21176 [Tagetes erecta]